ncbi:substrate-binding domain-containing protein [Bradyrhizobium embrapense]|uniref:substrate-binding domain-containing protein n=1 Tax=Bradyrhizobium embrapense TaxID=630921 RepID=UPI000A59653A|nr:substrate-binding domain-containing protein [Bradyrhizobium embrapense]
MVDTLFPVAAVDAALTEMRSAYPSVSVRLAVEAMRGPIAALTERRSALAVTVGEDFRDPRLALDAICAVQIVAVASADHPLARRGRKGVADLADHLQIVLSDPTPLSEGRSFGVLSPQVCRVSNQDTKHAMILAGLGWGRLPLWQVSRDLKERRLRVPGSWERSRIMRGRQSALHGPSRASRSGGFFVVQSTAHLNCPAQAGTGDPDPGARADTRVPKRAGPAGGNEAMSRTPMAE